jgi:dipeptidyl aminopeptidase/acylaminoacyl peptidase
VNHATESGKRFRLLVLVIALTAFFGAADALPRPQAPQFAPATSHLPAAASPLQQAAPTTEKRPLTVDDYTLWRSINDEQISADGEWVSYVLRFTNVADDEEKPVLHLLNLDTGDEIELQDASGGTFSKDSRWIAYQVDPGGGGAARGGRGRAGQGQAGDDEADETRRAELRNLSTGDVRSWQNIQSFEFSADSTHLMLRRRPPEAEGGGRGGGQGGRGDGGEDEPRGVDVVVHDLTTGRDQLLGSVGDISFNEEGDLLAYTVDAAEKDSNGLFVLDLASSRMHPLDNDAKRYSRLTWNEEGTALAVLKGDDVDGMQERANLLIAFPDLRATIAGATGGTASGPPVPVVLDPAVVAGFPDGWVMSERGALEWSADDSRVYFGIKEQAPDPTADEGDDEDDDEEADVDIWNTADERIQSRQMRQAQADRNFTYRQAFEVGASRFIELTDETMREIDVAEEGKWAVGRDEHAYISDYLPSRADIYRVDTTTGERTLMLESQLVGSHVFGISPDGRYYLYWHDDQVKAYDLEAGISSTLSGDATPSFVDTEFDRPGPRPSYGVAGYAADGSGVIMQDRYDLWFLPYDGSDARNLTNGVGADNEIRFRYVDTTPDDDGGGGGRFGFRGGRGREIDLSAPMTLSAYGQWTKKDGFYELDGDTLTEIVYEDASFSTPRRAADAETYLFTRETFVEFPDLRVSGPDFADAREISDANPQQGEFLWGRRILFDFENDDGVRLQGILALPDDYVEGEKRPMIVTFYEKNSQNLHRYPAPRYLTGMGSSPIQAVSEGYLTMLPDIHFRTGASHSDMLECVEAATRKVIEMGYVDPERIAVTGHSYGGEGAAFIGVRSAMFAAIGMGAGVTDLYSDFNQNWGWTYNIDGGSGNNGHGYYLYGQGREAVTPWENPELYRSESAITHVPDARAPFLIMHGTDDPTVAFQNGLGFYNALRLNDKTAILLAYPGEGHGLRRMANRRDLTVRYFQFFNHYLKGEPAPEWMTEGVSYLEKEGGGR